MRMVVICILLLLLCSSSPTVLAHSWYDADCCSDKDCHAVIKIDQTPTGRWMHYDYQGAPRKIFIPNTFKRIRPSKDAEYHVCVVGDDVGTSHLDAGDGGSPSEMVRNPICVYEPMMF